MIRSPQPYVFQVQIRCKLGYMHGHEGSDTVWVDGGWRCHDRRGSRTLTNVQVGACEATNAGMHIPNAGRGTTRSQVSFDKDSASLHALGADNHIRPLDGPRLSRKPDANNRPRSLRIREEGSA